MPTPFLFLATPNRINACGIVYTTNENGVKEFLEMESARIRSLCPRGSGYFCPFLGKRDKITNQENKNLIIHKFIS